MRLRRSSTFSMNRIAVIWPIVFLIQFDVMGPFSIDKWSDSSSFRFQADIAHLRLFARFLITFTQDFL
jgi:hypothetical protein